MDDDECISQEHMMGRKKHASKKNQIQWKDNVSTGNCSRMHEEAIKKALSCQVVIEKLEFVPETQDPIVKGKTKTTESTSRKRRHSTTLKNSNKRLKLSDEVQEASSSKVSGAEPKHVPDIAERVKIAARSKRQSDIQQKCVEIKLESGVQQKRIERKRSGFVKKRRKSNNSASVKDSEYTNNFSFKGSAAEILKQLQNSGLWAVFKQIETNKSLTESSDGEEEEEEKEERKTPKKNTVSSSEDGESSRTQVSDASIASPERDLQKLVPVIKKWNQEERKSLAASSEKLILKPPYKSQKQKCLSPPQCPPETAVSQMNGYIPVTQTASDRLSSPTLEEHTPHKFYTSLFHNKANASAPFQKKAAGKSLKCSKNMCEFNDEPLQDPSLLPEKSEKCVLNGVAKECQPKRMIKRKRGRPRKVPNGAEQSPVNKTDSAMFLEEKPKCTSSPKLNKKIIVEAESNIMSPPSETKVEKRALSRICRRISSDTSCRSSLRSETSADEKEESCVQPCRRRSRGKRIFSSSSSSEEHDVVSCRRLSSTSSSSESHAEEGKPTNSSPKENTCIDEQKLINNDDPSLQNPPDSSNNPSTDCNVSVDNLKTKSTKRRYLKRHTISTCISEIANDTLDSKLPESETPERVTVSTEKAKAENSRIMARHNEKVTVKDVSVRLERSSPGKVQSLTLSTEKAKAENSRIMARHNEKVTVKAVSVRLERSSPGKVQSLTLSTEKAKAENSQTTALHSEKITVKDVSVRLERSSSEKVQSLTCPLVEKVSVKCAHSFQNVRSRNSPLVENLRGQSPSVENPGLRCSLVVEKVRPGQSPSVVNPKSQSSPSVKSPKRQRSPSVESPRRQRSLSVESPKRQRSPSVESPKRQRSPSVERPRRQRSPSVESPKRQRSPSVESPRRQRSPSVESSRRHCSPSVESPKRKRSPSDESPRRQRSPSVESSRRKCFTSVESSRRQYSPSVESPKRKCSPSDESPRRQRSPSVESPRRKCFPSVESPRRKRSPSVESPRRKRSPSVESPRRKRSPSVESPRRKCSPSVESSRRQRSPSVESPRRKRSPSVESPRRKCFPSVESSRRKRSPSVESPRRQRSPSVESPRRQRSPSVESPRRQRSPSVESPRRKRSPSVESPKLYCSPSVESPKTQRPPSVDSPRSGHSSSIEKVRPGQSFSVENPGSRCSPLVKKMCTEQSPTVKNPRSGCSSSIQKVRLEQSVSVENPGSGLSASVEVVKLVYTPSVENSRSGCSSNKKERSGQTLSVKNSKLRTKRSPLVEDKRSGLLVSVGMVKPVCSPSFENSRSGCSSIKKDRAGQSLSDKILKLRSECSSSVEDPGSGPSASIENVNPVSSPSVESSRSECSSIKKVRPGLPLSVKNSKLRTHHFPSVEDPGSGLSASVEMVKPVSSHSAENSRSGCSSVKKVRPGLSLSVKNSKLRSECSSSVDPGSGLSASVEMVKPVSSHSAENSRSGCSSVMKVRPGLPLSVKNSKLRSECSSSVDPGSGLSVSVEMVEPVCSPSAENSRSGCSSVKKVKPGQSLSVENSRAQCSSSVQNTIKTPEVDIPEKQVLNIANSIPNNIHRLERSFCEKAKIKVPESVRKAKMSSSEMVAVNVISKFPGSNPWENLVANVISESSESKALSPQMSAGTPGTPEKEAVFASSDENSAVENSTVQDSVVRSNQQCEDGDDTLVFKKPFPVIDKPVGQTSSPKGITITSSGEAANKRKRTWQSERVRCSDDEDCDIISLFADSDFDDEDMPSVKTEPPDEEDFSPESPFNLSGEEMASHQEVLCAEQSAPPLEVKPSNIHRGVTMETAWGGMPFHNNLVVIEYGHNSLNATSMISQNVYRFFKGYCFRFLSYECSKKMCRFLHSFPYIEPEWQSEMLMNVLEYARRRNFDKFVIHIGEVMLRKAQKKQEWYSCFAFLLKLKFPPEEIARFMEVCVEYFDVHSMQWLLNSCASTLQMHPPFKYIFVHFWDVFHNHLVRSVGLEPIIINKLLKHCVHHDVDDFYMKCYNTVRSLPLPYLHKIPEKLLTQFYGKLQPNVAPSCSSPSVGNESGSPVPQVPSFTVSTTQKRLPVHDNIGHRPSPPPLCPAQDTASTPSTSATAAKKWSSHSTPVPKKTIEPIKLKRAQYPKPQPQLNSSDNVVPADFQNNYRIEIRQWSSGACATSAESDKEELQKCIGLEDYEVVMRILERWADRSICTTADHKVFTELQSMLWNTNVSFLDLLKTSGSKVNPLRKRILANLGMNKILQYMEQEEWSHAFDIYKWMQDNEICIEDTQVVDKLKTPCMKILSCAEICIRSGKLTEAVRLLRSKKLLAMNKKHWDIEGSSEDEKTLQLTWTHIMEVLMKRNVEDAFDQFRELSRHQIGLDAHLITIGVAVLVELLQKRRDKKAVELYTLIGLNHVIYMDLPTVRMLIVTLMQQNMERHARTLFVRATMSGFFQIKNEGSTMSVMLMSYMTKEEIMLGVKQLFNEIYNATKGNASLFNKYQAKILIQVKDLKNLKHNYFYLYSTTVNTQSEAQRRVIAVLQCLIPSIVVRQSYDNCLIVDSKYVQEYMLYLKNLDQPLRPTGAPK